MIDIEKIKNVESLPTLPSVATKILELVFDETTSINEIVALVESDQGLSIKVLKLQENWHDMGKIIIDRFEPEAYQAITKHCDENQDRLIIDLEKEVAVI